MNKADLIEKVAGVADLSKAAASKVVDAVHEAIREALIAGERVAIADWGTYSISERSARTGRNPQTGKAISIPASKIARFKPGKKLKDAVNEK